MGPSSPERDLLRSLLNLRAQKYQRWIAIRKVRLTAEQNNEVERLHQHHIWILKGEFNPQFWGWNLGVILVQQKIHLKNGNFFFFWGIFSEPHDKIDVLTDPQSKNTFCFSCSSEWNTGKTTVSGRHGLPGSGERLYRHHQHWDISGKRALSHYYVNLVDVTRFT